MPCSYQSTCYSLARTTSLTTVCLVCQGPSAAHTHYGAICCYSCRAFFRRGIHKNYACVRGDNSCQVLWLNRDAVFFSKKVTRKLKGSRYVKIEEDKVNAEHLLNQPLPLLLVRDRLYGHTPASPRASSIFMVLLEVTYLDVHLHFQFI